MLTQKEILKILRTRKEEIFSHYDVIKLGLFGSFARNEENENSDVDLIIEFRPNTKDISGKKEIIRSIFEKQFYRKVDLCREKYIKPYFKSYILKSAIYV